ncbi:uncharacterized protein [Mytilus edulis]|uniref:Acyl-ACP thioesterase n=1 Tax=Mytilus galloprovincialis TaxID=29158 RepID=A0A8B6D5L6_MYTGA|nr:Hypothetical predicted protein [Mytilus galloprovincialis]
MSCFIVNKADTAYAELTTRGTDYNFDDRSGTWNIWNASLFLDGAEYLAMKRYNFMYFNSLKSSHVSSVIIKEVMKLHPSLHNYTLKSDVEFRITTELGELGQTSAPLITKLFDAKSGQLLVERFVKLVFIDNETRRPVNNPEWFLNKHSHVQGIPPELSKMPLPEQPMEVYEYRTVVRYSDLDSNYHANYSLYVKSCMDCVTTASIDKKLVHFSGDICCYPVTFLSVDFLGECFVGDQILIAMWQHSEKLNEFMFFIYKDADKKKLTYVLCQFGLEKMFSKSMPAVSKM